MQAAANGQYSSSGETAQLRAAGDLDVGKTQREMLKNKYFQEFFNEYQSSLQQAFDELDHQAKNKKTKTSNYYSCKESYAPAMKKHMRDHNLYRRNESKITTNIEKEKLSSLVSEMDPRFSKLLIPGSLEDKVEAKQIAERRLDIQKKLQGRKSSLSPARFPVFKGPSANVSALKINYQKINQIKK